MALNIGDLRRPKDKIYEAATYSPVLDKAKKTLYVCLKRIKEARNEIELRRLKAELQRIVVHREYQIAEIEKLPRTRRPAVVSPG